MHHESTSRNAPTEENGLLFGCLLDGEGSATLADWETVERWQQGDAPLWVHLDRNSPRVQTWLRGKSGLTGPTVDALLAEETRPRVFRGKRGFATILRGINTNADEMPEDMVAMRMWSDGHRVITIRQEKLKTPRDILAQLLDEESGPTSAPVLYERLIHRITERMAESIASFDQQLDEIEENFDISSATEQRRALSDLRHKANLMRRYLSPQREALSSILSAPPEWFADENLVRLRDTTDRMLRYVEEIDASRERATVIKDDIANQVAESTNRTLYILAMLSGIFLPLAFLTGLLGINIGGMPGVNNEYAFWIFCGMMVVVLVIEVVLLRRLRWL